MVPAAALLVLGVIVTIAPVISFANAAPTVTFAGGVPAVVIVDDPAAEPRIYLSGSSDGFRNLLFAATAATAGALGAWLHRRRSGR